MTHTDEDLLALADYDAGLLNDFGGGDVNWWMDYLRAEIGRANDYWRDALRAIVAERQKPQHRKEVMPNDEDNSNERPAVSPRLTAGAQAVRVKPLVWTKVGTYGRDCLDASGLDYTYRIVAKADGRFWLTWPDMVTTTLEAAKAAAQSHHEARILAELDVSETPESDRQTDLLSASERQAIRDKTLDDAAQAASNRAAFFRDAAETASEAGFHALRAFHAMRELCLVEIAAAIRAMKGTTE